MNVLVRITILSNALELVSACTVVHVAENRSTNVRQVNLDKLFWSKPCSLALDPSSPLRVEEPKYEGIKHIMLKLMLFYSKQSKSIRGANAVYWRITSQVDTPTIYEGDLFLN